MIIRLFRFCVTVPFKLLYFLYIKYWVLIVTESLINTGYEISKQHIELHKVVQMVLL